MSISMHTGPITAGTHTHMQTPLHGPLPQMSQSLLFPWCFVPGRYPSRAASLWTPTTSSKRNERSEEGQRKKKKQKKKRKKRERKSSVFLITSPWGFQLRRWGRSKQFCLSCFCCVALSFRGRFCFELSSSLFLIFCWEIEGVINADPLPIYSPLFAPLYSVLGRFPLVINSQQN